MGPGVKEAGFGVLALDEFQVNDPYTAVVLKAFLETLLDAGVMARDRPPPTGSRRTAALSAEKGRCSIRLVLPAASLHPRGARLTGLRAASLLFLLLLRRL